MRNHYSSCLHDGPTLDDSKATQFPTLIDKEYTMFLTALPELFFVESCFFSVGFCWKVPARSG